MTIGWPAIGLLLAAVGCTTRSLDPVGGGGPGASSGSGAGGAGDASAPPVTVFSRPPCGGTVDATGTTPDGPFVAASIWARYDFCTGGDLYAVLRDASDRPLQLVSRLPPPPDGGTEIVPQTVAVAATLVPADGSAATTTTGKLTIVSANVPWTADGAAGGLTATFDLTNDGFSLAGSFSSPYCWVDDLCSD